jgi:hypothetical protein
LKKVLLDIGLNKRPRLSGNGSIEGYFVRTENKKVKFRRILSFGIFYICIVFRFILPRSGMLVQEKSGKPDSEAQ